MLFWKLGLADGLMRQTLLKVHPFVLFTEVVFDGFFHESEFRSAPYFDVQIDGIELLNAKY